MGRNSFIITLLMISLMILSGCMTTGPIVDDLDHYKKGDTYEDIRGTVEGNEILQDLEKQIFSNENIEIDYGTSDIFSNEEIDEVMNIVLKNYDTRSSHPEVYRIYYNGDEMSLYELNYFEKYLGIKYDKCLVIYSNFYMDLDETENTFETNDITDYSRTACKYELGEWELVNHGFM